MKKTIIMLLIIACIAILPMQSFAFCVKKFDVTFKDDNAGRTQTTYVGGTGTGANNTSSGKSTGTHNNDHGSAKPTASPDGSSDTKDEEQYIANNGPFKAIKPVDAEEDIVRNNESFYFYDEKHFWDTAGNYWIVYNKDTGETIITDHLYNSTFTYLFNKKGTYEVEKFRVVYKWSWNDKYLRIPIWHLKNGFLVDIKYNDIFQEGVYSDESIMSPKDYKLYAS